MQFYTKRPNDHKGNYKLKMIDDKWGFKFYSEESPLLHMTNDLHPLLSLMTYDLHPPLSLMTYDFIQ
jgi:hypothetical protein